MSSKAYIEAGVVFSRNGSKTKGVEESKLAEGEKQQVEGRKA
jgi:hypothetical protein